MFFSFYNEWKEAKTFVCWSKSFRRKREFFCFFLVFVKDFRWVFEKKIKIVAVAVFLSWKEKFLTRNKISRYLNSFASVLLICDKIRRFVLSNSSVSLAISFVEKYDFANSVTIIVNRFSVSMSMFLRLSIKSKKRNSVFAFVEFSISDLFDVVFFSTLFDVVSAFSTRFFVSLSNDYRDSFSVRRFRFFSKILQEEFHVLFYFSINLKKKSVKYFSNFWRIQTRQRNF